jgi:hypothetical protein
MFTDFIKVFDRNFFVAYITPVFLFILLTYKLISTFFPNYSLMLFHSDLSLQNGSNSIDILWNASILIIIIWYVSILLMLLNVDLIRFLEGYGILGKTFLLSSHKIKYRTLESKVKIAKYNRDNEIREKGVASGESRRIYNKLKKEFRNEFPPHEDYVLATDFGNVIRSFELYSYEKYGMDAIAIWERINCLVPKEHLDYLDSTKAHVDLAINLFYLMIFLTIEYFISLLISRCISQGLSLFWLPIISIILVVLAYRLAIVSALRWGVAVKSVFDLYRHDLLRKMGFEIPTTLQGEKKYWRRLNRVFLYSDAFNLEDDSRDGYS